MDFESRVGLSDQGKFSDINSQDGFGGGMRGRLSLSDTLQGQSMPEMFGNTLIFLGANFSHTIRSNWKSTFVEI